VKEIAHDAATVLIGLCIVGQMLLWAGSWTPTGDRWASHPAATGGTLAVLALTAVVWAMTDRYPQPVWLFTALAVFAVFAIAEAARLELRRRRRKRSSACWRGSSC
jgi:hypothetical protein